MSEQQELDHNDAVFVARTTVDDFAAALYGLASGAVDFGSPAFDQSVVGGFVEATGTHLEDFFGKLAESVPVVPLFDFCSLKEPSMEHIQFAGSLVSRNVFRLPYPSIVLKTSVGGVEGGMWAYMSEVSSGDISYWLFMSFGQEMMFVPFSQGAFRCKDGDIAHVSETIFSQGEDEEGLNFRYYAGYCMIGLIASLMSAGVSVQQIDYSAKLNKARAKKGKPPKPTKHVVTINPGARYVPSYAGDGLRKAPKPHWRRGHFRRLSLDRVVPVAPALVGNSLEVSDLGKRMYRTVQQSL